MLEVPIDELIGAEIVNVITNYDKRVQSGEELYFNAANMGSHGATLSFIIDLGILTQYFDSPKEKKDEIIRKCVTSLDKQLDYVRLIDDFINNKVNNTKSHI